MNGSCLVPVEIRPVGPPLGGQHTNFISVRQKPDQDGGWGTLRQPKPLELPLLHPLQVRSKLGYEAVPASEFWCFELKGRSRLLVNRISTDRYANCVGVALLNRNNQRVAPLVQSASGRGVAVDVPAGFYKLVASLGIAELIKDLILEIEVTPLASALRANALTIGSGRGWLRDTPQLRAAAITVATGTAAPRRPLQQAAAASEVTGAAQLLSTQPRLSARATAAAGGSGRVHPQALHTLRAAVVVGPAGGSGRLAAVQWLAAPSEPWRARQQPLGGERGVAFNSAYVRFGRGVLEDQALLLELQQQL